MDSGGGAGAERGGGEGREAWHEFNLVRFTISISYKAELYLRTWNRE